MSLSNKYKNFSGFEKLGVWGSVASLVGLAIVFWPSAPSPATTIQTATGDSATQIGTVQGGVTINQQPQAYQAEPEDVARGQRAAAESMRSIARDRIPIQPPFPEDWLIAENHFNSAKEEFKQHNFKDAANSYKDSASIYSDIVSRTNDQ